MAKIVEKVGDYSAVIEVQPPGIARLDWRNAAGRPLKNTPRKVPGQFPERHRAIKEKLESIRNTLKVQTRRIESFYLEDRSIPYAQWRQCYADHPLMKSIVSHLIWRFDTGNQAFSAIPDGARLVLADASPAPGVADDAKVTLWHPLLSDEQERDAWRNHVWKNAIAQPFRQAYREIYSGDEKTEVDTIVSGLYVRQHQFRSLLLGRGWRYAFHGSFDRESDATRTLRYGLTCAISIRGASTAVSHRGISLAVELGDIHFSRRQSRLASAEVSPVVLSEMLRDVDLFTSVTGIGYRDDWEDLEASFKELAELKIQQRLASAGESAPNVYSELLSAAGPLREPLIAFLTRLEMALEKRPIPQTTRARGLLLQTLLNESSLADRTRVDGRYVYVDTTAGQYRINLASGLAFSMNDNRWLGVVGKTGSDVISGEAGNDALLSMIHGAITALADEARGD